MHHTSWSIILAVALSTLNVCTAFAARPTAQPAIPVVRFRTLYNETLEPVKWLFVDIRCVRKLSWSERRKKNQEYEKTYSSFGFYQTQDGWLTLPAVEAPRTTEYEIEVYAPACGYNLICPYKFPARYPYGGHAGMKLTLCEQTVPIFVKLPEEKRVLYAQYANDDHWFIPIQQNTYEGIQYSLDALKLFFSEWPTLATNACGQTPPHGSWSEGESKARAPYYKENYYQHMRAYVHCMQKNISYYERRILSPYGVRNVREQQDNTPLSSEQLAELEAKATELRTRLHNIVCNDLQEKKIIWDTHKLLPAQERHWWPATLGHWRAMLKAREGQKEFEPPSVFMDDPFIQEANCEALREFYAKNP